MHDRLLRHPPSRQVGREGGLDLGDHLHQIGTEARAVLSVQHIDLLHELDYFREGVAWIVLHGPAHEFDRAPVIPPPPDALCHAPGYLWATWCERGMRRSLAKGAAIGPVLAVVFPLIFLFFAQVVFG